jgi:signal transduction histidine kinase
MRLLNSWIFGGFIFGLFFPVVAVILYSVKFDKPLWDVFTDLEPFRVMTYTAPLVLTAIGFLVERYREALKQKVEIELNLSEAQRVAGVGSWYFDLATQKISWSDELYRVFRVDKKEGAPSFEKFKSLIHPDDLPQLLGCIENCRTHGTSYSLRHRIRSGNELSWVHGSGCAVKDDYGKIIRMTGICQDVTHIVTEQETKAHQTQKIEEQKSQLESLIQNSPGMVFTYRLSPLGEGMYTFVSPQVESIYEIDSRLISRDPNLLNKMISPDLKEAFQRALMESSKNQSPLHWVGRIVSGLGRSKWIRSHALPKIQADGAVVWDGVVVDITEEKKMEEDLLRERQKSIQNSKLASLGEMSAGIAHEINNPLSIIQGNVQLLPKFVDQPEKFQEKISTINKSCDRITKIVRGLRKFSRSTAVKEMKAHNVYEMLSEVLVLTHARAMKSQVEIRIKGERAAEIICDEIEVEQVFVNLVNNAVDAVKDLQEKWVELEVESDEKFINIKVKDSGFGIPVEMQQKLFDPFFTTKSVGQGTGLGLSIAKKIVDDHCGRLFIDDQSKHTCFVVSFPRDPAVHDSTTKTV